MTERALKYQGIFISATSSIFHLMSVMTLSAWFP